MPEFRITVTMTGHIRAKSVEDAIEKLSNMTDEDIRLDCHMHVDDTVLDDPNGCVAHHI